MRRKADGASSRYRTGHAVFCDDIRFEVGNKFSLIGIYGPELQIQSALPILLPKFGVSTTFLCPIEDIPENISVILTFPDGSEGLKTEVPPEALMRKYDADQDVTGFMITQNFLMSPLLVNCEGYLEIWFETGIDKFRAGRLKITSVPAPLPAT